MARLGDIKRSRKKVRKAAWTPWIPTSHGGGASYQTRRHPRKGTITYAIERDVYGKNYGVSACYGRKVHELGDKRVSRSIAGRVRYKGRCGYGQGSTPTKALNSALRSLIRVSH